MDARVSRSAGLFDGSRTEPAKRQVQVGPKKPADARQVFFYIGGGLGPSERGPKGGGARMDAREIERAPDKKEAAP